MKSKLFQIILMGVFFTPIFIIFTYIFKDSGDIWTHIKTYLLSEYIYTTLYLGVGVGFISFFFGSLCAWVTSVYEFRFRKIFEYSLILPLAIPAYIAAYMYGGILGIGGWINEFLVNNFSLTYADIWFLDVMNSHGAIFVMGFVFYPYVYLMTKSAFKQQNFSIFEAATIHGYGQISLFFKIFIPSMRPAIAAGTFLAIMEAISDFGVVSYFGVNSFVNGIFKAWTGLGNLAAATKLASMLMIFVFLLVWIEKYFRKKAQYAQNQKSFKPIQRQRLSFFGSILAIFVCFIPLLFGFILPLLKLFEGFFLTYKDVINDGYLEKTLNTFLVGAITSLSVTIIGFIIIYLSRNNKSKLSNLSEQVAKLGYSIPGAIIGIGVLVTLSWIDSLYSSLFSYEGMLLGGGLLALIYGYSVRFLAVSCSCIEGGYSKIPHSYSQAAKIMGYGEWSIIKKIDLILLKGTFGTSLILVFVEILKELPLTLILRPFDFETLSTYAMELSAQEMLAETSVPSLSIVAMTMIPTIVLIKTLMKD